MNKYVVLLRGVNVGGNNRVPKEDFQKVLEGLDFSNIRIYLNSGNAVFASSKTPSVEIIQNALEKRFKFNIPTLLIDGKTIIKIASQIPKDWTNDPLKPDKSGRKSDVIYLFPTIDTPEILNRLKYNHKIESMIYTKGSVITSILRKNQSEGSLKKLVNNKDIYNNVTIRNVNTALKLAELVAD